MSKSTHPITYVYEIHGHTVEITRSHIGSAYARNGNVANGAEYFTWNWTVGGATGGGMGELTRSSAYEHARAMIEGVAYYDHPNYPHRWRGVRYFRLVADEMKANYRRRVTPGQPPPIEAIS